MKITVERVGIVDTITEDEAQMGCVLAVVKIGRYKVSKHVGPGMLKCLLDALSFRVKDLCQKLLCTIGLRVP